MEGLVVYQDQSDTVVRGRSSGRELHRSADAAKAFEAAASLCREQQGGEIFVECGVYEIERPIELSSKTTLRGSGPATVLKLSQSNAAGVVVRAVGQDCVTVADLTCEGFDQAGDSIGVLFEDCGDSSVRSVTSRDFDCGIVLRKGCFMAKLLDTKTMGNRRSGILISENGKTRGGYCAPNLVMGCTSMGEAGHGIEIEHSFCTNLVGCQIHQSLGHGILVHDRSNSTCITGCRVFQSSSNGIMVDSSHEINISSNIVCWNKGHGIELKYVVWGTVSANNIIDNGGRSEPKRHGVYIHTDTKSVQVTANAIFNWQGHLPMLCGVFESEDCSSNQITHNTINYFVEEAVASRGAGSVVEANMAVPTHYPHPDRGPFLPPEPAWVGNEFSRGPLQQFLQMTRSNAGARRG